MTAASQKDYPVDLSHFSILGGVVGAQGVAADSDVAIFPNVDLSVTIGREPGIKLRMPISIPGLGSTDVAKRNWEGLAVGAAISGVPLTIGENVCGMDPEAEFVRGRVVRSPELARRVRTYQEWQDGYGAIIVQANVEDTRLAVQEYALQELGVEIVELKWGQGAKDIGGEVKISDLDRAQLLKSRGYIVLPDPTDPGVIGAFRKGVFKEFERHSRIGMVSEESFLSRVAELRAAGAKHIFLKTGAYRPLDLARAVKYSSIAGIDVLTVDGAGGGTGMSPWRMMNEWGIPTVELASLTREYARRLAEQGAYVPDIVLAGGFSLEDHLFKGLALGAPFVKAIGMARAPMAAVMVGKTIGHHVENENVPSAVQRYGQTIEEIFISSVALTHRYGRDFNRLPASAIGLYTYFERVAQGLRQFMCGARKFKLEHISRDDICALTREAAEISGIRYVTEVDADEVDQLLGESIPAVN